MPQLPNPLEQPDKLHSYLETTMGTGLVRMRRRAVLIKSPDGWQLVCCVAEAFPNPQKQPSEVITRKYPAAILHESWLDLAGVHDFLRDMQSGIVHFDDIAISQKSAPFWQLDLVPLKNNFMQGPGYVAHTPYSAAATLSQDPVISPVAPYYPDEIEAARDWLGLAIYHGQTDGRNREIVFLLPEARAFFTGATSEGDALRLAIGGNMHTQLKLKVSGAFWDGNTIHHFTGPVVDGEARFTIPENTDRLDYVLIDQEGEVYDRQFEGHYGNSGLVRTRAGQTTDRLAQLVLNACAGGEGLVTEFKPWVDHRESLGARGKKTKYCEIVRTIAAFANAQGGTIFLGIDDNCAVVGIDDALRAFAKTDAISDAFESYRGSLLNTIRGDIEGDVRIRIASVEASGGLIGVIEVAQANTAPLTVRGETIYYVRVGSSNKILTPTEWGRTFAERNPNDAAAFLRNDLGD